MKNRHFEKNLFLLLFPIIAVILEFFPNGVAMRFGVPPGEEPIIEYCSYFSLLPFGYGNMMPLITAIITCSVLVIIIFYCINKNHELIGISKFLLGAGIIFSVISFVLFGMENVTVIGILITVSLAAEFFVLMFVKKPFEPKNQTKTLK